jgi:hypothetical protein
MADSIGPANAFNNYSVRVIDLDEDGNLDILASYGETQNKLVWFQGDGTGSFSNEKIIATSYVNAVDLTAGYIDGDNFLDIVGGAFWGGDDVSWWQNDGTPLDGGWTKNGIQSSYAGANSVELVDLDDDGDLDVLAAAWGPNANNSTDDKISWWKNIGSGNFGSENVIVSNFWNARNANGIDMDGDGDVDIVGAADESNTVSWFENDGMQNYTERLITNSFNYAYYVFPLDLDGDGDADVVASAQNDNEVAWWENSLDDDQLVAAGNPAPVSFWNGKVIIDFSAGTEDSVTVFNNTGAVPERANLGSGIDHLAQNGYYTITTRKTGYSASIDFYYGAGQVPEWSAINDELDLVICLWNANTVQWEYAGINQIVNTAEDKITVEGISAGFERFSRWTIGSSTTDNALPVELFAFNAVNRPAGIQLLWSTASEIDNLGFEIWRSVERDSNYLLITDYLSNPELQGAGNSNMQQNYAFLDRDVESGVPYFYRLVSIDFNHKEEIYGPLQVTRSLTVGSDLVAAKMSIELGQNYPNPFNATTRIPVFLNDQSPVSGVLRFFDILGREVDRIILTNLAVGENTIQWHGKNFAGKSLPSGVYYYLLEVEEAEKILKKMIIAK